MTTFEICKQVRSVVLTRAGELMAYRNWEAKFAQEYMTKLAGEMAERAKWFSPINANDLTAPELDELGFGTWSDEKPIRLVPIWILPFLRDEIDAESISGKKVTSVKAEDNDHRFGCVAFGVMPKEPA